MAFISKSYTSAVTDEVLIDVTSPQKILITGIYLAAAAATSITAEFDAGTDVQIASAPAGTSVNIHSLPRGEIKGDAGQDLLITTSGTTQATVTVLYEIDDGVTGQSLNK